MRRAPVSASDLWVTISSFHGAPIRAGRADGAAQVFRIGWIRAKREAAIARSHGQRHARCGVVLDPIHQYSQAVVRVGNRRRRYSLAIAIDGIVRAVQTVSGL